MDPPAAVSRATKQLAQGAVEAAVKQGRLTRPQACESCGGGGQIHGHHDDYSKPLQVRWLCRSCHAAVHRAPEPDWVPRARALRAMGETYEAISEKLGPSASAVYKRLNPKRCLEVGPRRSGKREYDNRRTRDPELRGRCRRCDGEMGIGVRHDGTCASCRRGGHEARVALIESWWSAGWTVTEIANRLGCTVGSVGGEMVRLRASGANLPYRNACKGRSIQGSEVAA